MNRITDSMSTKQKLSILYWMVEKDAEQIFNLCRSFTKDPKEKLALIWEDHKNTYGHSKRGPRTELDKLHRKPAIDFTKKGIKILRRDLGHAQIYMQGGAYQHELDSLAFTEG